MKNKIEIGGEIHPLIFNMNSLRNVMSHIGMESFADLQKHLDMAKALDLSLICAFYGILEGYEIDGKQSPFLTESQIGRKITKYTELLPAMNGFSQAITDFFTIEEGDEKK
jgi:hypothetical protein